MRLLSERVDDFPRLLACPDAGLDRSEERGRQLLQVEPRLVVLVPQQEPRDRDRRDREADDHHGEVGEEQPARDAARH